MFKFIKQWFNKFELINIQASEAREAAWKAYQESSMKYYNKLLIS